MIFRLKIFYAVLQKFVLTRFLTLFFFLAVRGEAVKDRDGSDLAEARKVSREQVHDLKHPTVRRRLRSRPDVFGAYGKRLIEADKCKKMHLSASVSLFIVFIFPPRCFCLTRYLK